MAVLDESNLQMTYKVPPQSIPDFNKTVMMLPYLWRAPCEDAGESLESFRARHTPVHTGQLVKLWSAPVRFQRFRYQAWQ